MEISPVKPLSAPDPTVRNDATAAPKPTKAELAKAAQQFEAIMVRQMIAPAIEPMMSGSSLGGDKSGGESGGGVYGYMLTDVLSTSITQGGGLGLADVITRQLSPRADLKDLT
jgi:peptidoglycan hydrolase FlgJ